MIFRQGDILFVEASLDKAKRTTIRRQRGRIVVAEGEVTGHAHAVMTPGVKLVQQFQEHFLVSPKPFEVVHEEHDTVQMPAGTFRVVHQREYSPEEIRRVMD